MRKSAILACTVATAMTLTTVSGQPSATSKLPDGPGKELVQAASLSCRIASAITRAQGYDKAVRCWAVMSTMIKLPRARAAPIAESLAERFREQPERRPTMVDGPAESDMQEWTVPSLGQRSRDPAQAPDGSIWWTGMWASLAGHVDISTGEMQEFHLPPEAVHHSIVPDRDDKIWYAGNSNGTIGMLDPNSGLITEYPTQAGNPRIATCHHDGKLYFTAQRAGELGLLDPESGDLAGIETEPRPYGI